MPATAEARYSTAELSRQEHATLTSSSVVQVVDELSGPERTLATGIAMEPVFRTRTFSSRGTEVQFKYRDVGPALPRWFEATLQGFADLFTLPPNWDTYGAGPISQLVLSRGLSLVDWLMGPDTHAPSIVPLSGGGIQMEWHHNAQYLELVVTPEEGVRYFYHDSRSGTEEEEPLIGHETRIQELVSQFR